MAEAYLLSASDREWLMALVHEYVTARENPANRQPLDWAEHQAPEVYLVFTETGGISALSQSGTTGTGTSAAADDVPGWGMCRVYQLVPDPTQLLQVGQYEVRVWNFNTIAIPQGMWVTVLRDKHGNWLVPCSGFQFGNC